MKRLFLLALLVCLAASAASLPVLLSKAAAVRTETISLRGVDRDHQYSVLYSLTSLAAMGTVDVEIRQGSRILTAKTLHSGDADFYAQFRLPESGPASIVVNARPNTRCR